MAQEGMTEVIIGRVSPEMAADIRQLAARMDLPISQILRDAITRYVAEPPQGLVHGRILNG